MDEEPPAKPIAGRDFGQQVGRKETRKLKAQRQKPRSIWFGFAMFGLIGWSVAVPMLLGVALGVWIDKHHPTPHSWTLMLLVIGLILGCLNACRWVSKEHLAIRDEHGDDSGRKHERK